MKLRRASAAGSLLLASVFASACVPAGAQAPAAAVRNVRLMPPPTLSCSRDQLTAYIGVVSAYKRGDDRTQITLRTDWDTTETVTLEHPGAADAARHYRLGGAPFRATDWARIEAAPGVLHAGLRAAAWVCADGRTPPVVDWRPGDPGPRSP